MKEVKEKLRDKELEELANFKKALWPLLKDSSAPHHLLSFLALSPIPPPIQVNAFLFERPNIQLPALLAICQKHPDIKPKVERKVQDWIKFSKLTLRKQLIPFVARILPFKVQTLLTFEKGSEIEKQVYSQLLFLHLHRGTDQTLQKELLTIFLRSYCPYEKFLQSFELSLRSITFQSLLKEQQAIFKRMLPYSKLDNRQRGYIIKAEMCSFLCSMAPHYQHNFHLLLTLPINQVRLLVSGNQSSTIKELRTSAKACIQAWQKVESEFCIFERQKKQSKSVPDPFLYNWHQYRKELTGLKNRKRLEIKAQVKQVKKIYNHINAWHSKPLQQETLMYPQSPTTNQLTIPTSEQKQDQLDRTQSLDSLQSSKQSKQSLFSQQDATQLLELVEREERIYRFLKE